MLPVVQPEHPRVYVHVGHVEQPAELAEYFQHGFCFLFRSTVRRRSRKPDMLKFSYRDIFRWNKVFFSYLIWVEVKHHFSFNEIHNIFYVLYQLYCHWYFYLHSLLAFKVRSLPIFHHFMSLLASFHIFREVTGVSHISKKWHFKRWLLCFHHHNSRGKV